MENLIGMLDKRVMAIKVVKRNWLRWLEHVVWKDDGDWMKRSIYFMKWTVYQV